ncbi:MAG: hypothetical protein ACJ8DC_16570 [Gemmatimonadales bacterium]
MYCPICQLPIARRFRAKLRRLLALGFAALGACEGGGDPLAPSNASSVSAAESAKPDLTVAAAGTSQRIAFTTTRNGGYDVYKMDPQGNSIAPLANSGDWEFAPGWTRTNGWIAMVRPRLDASNQYHYDIWETAFDGSNGKWVRFSRSPYDLGTPSWSPDASHLAVEVQISGVWYIGWIYPGQDQMGVYSTGFGGRQGRYPSYTASGQIVYVGPTGKTIERINADGSGHKQLYSSTTGVGEPAYSPDGKKVAFEKLVGFNQDIFVKNLVDGTVTRLTTHSAPDVHPTWSPDGTKIAFSSARSGQYQIWTMNAATGGDLARITHTTTVERDPSWSH